MRPVEKRTVFHFLGHKFSLKTEVEHDFARFLGSRGALTMAALGPARHQREPGNSSASHDIPRLSSTILRYPRRTDTNPATN